MLGISFKEFRLRVMREPPNDPPSNKRLTLGEFSRKVGFSPATVSYVLNGKAAQLKIAAATVERILAAAKRHRFRPNALARSLRRQRSDTVGVITGTLDLSWTQRIMDGMQPVLDRAGYTALIAIHRWNEDYEQREFRSLIERQVDAIITQPLPLNGAFYADVQKNYPNPLLLLGDSLPEWPQFNVVAWDSGPAAEAVVAHLIANGRKRIAFVGAHYTTVMTQARYIAYCRQLEKAGIAVERKFVKWQPSGAPAAPALKELFDASPKPDAIFAMNDSLALQVLEFLNDRGIEVPGQVAVAALGDLPLAGTSMINLTTAREPCEALGAAAAEGIIQLLQDPSSTCNRLISCVDLKLRRTSAVTSAKKLPAQI